jgi:hypothetical protein
MKYLVLTLSILLYQYSNVFSQHTNAFSENWEAISQIESVRTGLDTLEYIETLFSLEDKDLFEFAYLTADSSGNLAGYDFNLEKILFFKNDNYNDIKFLTDGIGRGPREMKLVRDLEFDKNGDLWALDLEGGKITQWSINNELLKSFKPNRKHARPYRLALCSSYLTILSEQYLGEGLFHSFDLRGTPKNSFMRFSIADRDDLRILTNASYFRGDLKCYNNSIYQVGKFKNYIRKYDNDGNLIFSKKVIEFSGNPEPLLEIDKRSSRRRADVKTISGNIEVIKGGLLISFSGKRNSYFYLLDIYDQDGNYKISYQFRHPTNEFTTDGKYIFTLETHREDKKQYISKYKLPNFFE